MTGPRYASRIGVLTWGSEGDVRPFGALARGLAEAGHEVTFSFADVGFAESPQLSLPGVAKTVAVTPPHDLAAFRRLSRQLTQKKMAPEKQIALIFERFLYPMEQQLLHAAEALCRDNDLVVGHFVVYPLALAALKAGKPRVAVFTAPAHPSREYVPAGVPELGAMLTRLFWWVAGFGVERMFGGPARRLFRAHGLAPAKSLLNDVWGSPLLNLVGVSPTLFPQPTDWPAHTTVCGHLSLSEQKPWEMPESLRRFLAEGAPPVFMTFGSMTAIDEDARAVTLRLVDAARQAGCRAIIQSDWVRGADLPEYPGVFRLSHAPHEALFPLCRAVVHHGGAGTSHAAARAGRPSVVVAHATDQLFWAATLRRAGLAGAPLERHSFTSERLAAAIRLVLESTEMTRRAAEIGEAMRREDGVRAAVERISAVLPRA